MSQTQAQHEIDRAAFGFYRRSTIRVRLEQGRGFAVVGVEVRGLAQRSAAAAREIKALIGASVDRVNTGTAAAVQPALAPTVQPAPARAAAPRVARAATVRMPAIRVRPAPVRAAAPGRGTPRTRAAGGEWMEF